MLNSLSKFRFIRTIWELVFCLREAHSSPIHIGSTIVWIVRSQNFGICMGQSINRFKSNFDFHAPKWTHRPNLWITGNHMYTLNPNVMYLYRHYDCFAAYCLPNFRIYFNLFAKFLKMMESEFTVNYQALRTCKWITVSLCVCVWVVRISLFSNFLLKIFQWHSTFRNLSVFGNWGNGGCRNAHFVSYILCEIGVCTPAALYLYPILLNISNIYHWNENKNAPHGQRAQSNVIISGKCGLLWTRLIEIGPSGPTVIRALIWMWFVFDTESTAID